MKDTTYINAVKIMALLFFGFAIGGITAEFSVESRMKREAVAAGVAEWVLVDDSMGYKPHFEFRYKTSKCE